MVLYRFSVEHHEKVEYFTLDLRMLWSLFCKALLGWRIEITAVKNPGSDKMYFTITGEKKLCEKSS